MTSMDATPVLLPGVPASTWARAAAIAIPFAVPVYLVLGYFQLTERDDDSRFDTWFVPLLVYAVITFGSVLVFGFLTARKSKREVAAGYTTQWRSQPTLPQLDARTGALVRAAGQPYVKRSEWRERSFAGGATPTPAADVSPWGQNKPGPWVGFVALLPSLVVPIVGIAGISGYLGVRGGNPVESVSLTVLAFAVVFAIFVGVGAWVVHGRIQRLERAAPGDFVFVFAKSKGYSDAFVDQPLRTGPATGYVQRGVSADADGMTVWEGNPYEQVLHFRWDAITSIQVDRLADNTVNNFVVLVTFTSQGGSLGTLPLAYPKFNSFPLASKSGTTWIVAQLNGLREHKTTPRVI